MKELMYHHNNNGLRMQFINFILTFSILLFLQTMELHAAKKPGSGISIQKVTIGEERIATGRKQLIEVLIKNVSQRSFSTVVKLSIVLPNHNIINFGNKKVNLLPRSETRVLFPYPINKARGGDYTVGAKVYSHRGRVLARTTEKQQKFFFAVDSTRRNQKAKRPFDKEAARKKAEAEKAKKAQMAQVSMFDPPDLAIEKLSIVNNNSILRGETAHVRMIVSNLGGDIATDIEYTVYWYFAPRENRKIKTFSQTISVIAPGERKVIDVPVTIPQIEQKGEYYVYAVVDEPNKLKELNEKNNTAVSKKSIIFSDIALVFPDEKHSFAEDGLFKFQWRSKRYNQFKIQVSSDKLFSNYEEIFELPKGEEEEGWTPDNMLKPLSGEMPSMALALMESNGIDYLFWRVKAKDSEGGTTESTVRQFYISLKADLK